MIKEFSQNRNNAIMNFSSKYCRTKKELIDSIGFQSVLSHYIKNLKKNDASLLERLNNLVADSLESVLLELLKLLLILDTEEIEKLNAQYNVLLANEEDLFDFIEGLYSYWRHLERYALIQQSPDSNGIEDNAFIKASDEFSDLVRDVYRDIEHNLTNEVPNVYRQTQAGVNVGFVISKVKTDIPKRYHNLSEIPFINRIILYPPFIMYPKENKREGLFKEVFENPLKDIPVNKDHFFCYVANVGESLAYVYFHRDFLSQGIALSNLFRLATEEEFKNKKPDLIYVFGARNKTGEKETVYFDDKENDVLVGYVNNTEVIDYFGYMKKMILTLHNTRMLNKRNLPIHGAMVNITLKNGRSANVAIVGDSGAGKSESLEAFRTLSEDHLKEMKIIFDDMGSFSIINNQVIGYGTEIGAFVRLDDLDMGYSFKEMDRAIFMNPNRINARVLIPITTYETITKAYKVDVLLYANNYTDNESVLQFFTDVESAKDTFVKGARRAKGTTAESGLVTSFFANPFGLVQRQEMTSLIIDEVYDKLFENNIPVGEIYTKLAIDGFQRKGPEDAALALFDWLIKN